MLNIYLATNNGAVQAIGTQSVLEASIVKPVKIAPIVLIAIAEEAVASVEKN